MSLLKPVELKQAYLKMGIYGEPKSGKTYTASLIAIGLHKMIKSKKPIAFFDTETGSEYVLRSLYEPAGIKLVSMKSRSFQDLIAVHKEAEETCDVLIVDSVTHVWTEIQDAYKKKHKLEYVEFQDWGPIKKEWESFTTAYLNSKLHVIVCGRAKDIYEYSTNERGKKELNVVGSRMATEKNLAYEPSLLVEMEKVADPKTGYLVPRAWVLGDRFSTLDGKSFDKPDFNTFLPHIKLLNIGGEHEGIDQSRNSEGLFQPGSNESRNEYLKKKDIALEEIENEMVMKWPGQDKESKQAKIEILRQAFGSGSWTMITNLPLDKIQEGLLFIRKLSPVSDVEKAMEAVENGVKGAKK
jgi:AAA domain-containing protein